MKRLVLLFLAAMLVYNLALAQDPNDPGAPDTVYFVCAQMGVPPSAPPHDVKIDMYVWTDNDVQGITWPFYDKCWPVGAPSAALNAFLDPLKNTDALVFSGSIAAAADIKGLNLTGDPLPCAGFPNGTPTPPYASLGAVKFAGALFVAPGGLLGHLVYTVNDQVGCICLDTAFIFCPPPTGVQLSMVRTDAVPYVPIVKPIECCVYEIPNQCPIPNGGGPYDGFVGATLHTTFTATDPDLPANTISLVGVTALTCGSIENPTFTDNGNGTGQGSYDFNTTGCLEGSAFVEICVVDQYQAMCCDTVEYVLISKCGDVIIDQVEPGVNPGDIVMLPVYWQGNVDIGGFKFIIEWDPTVLTLLGVERGTCIDDIDFWFGHNAPHYKWEKFYYEQLFSTDIHKRKVKLVGLADVPDGYQGYPILSSPDTCAIAFLKFQVKNDATLKEFKLPVFFEWDSWSYDENTLSDPTGYVWYVSVDPEQFPWDTTGPNVQIMKCIYFFDGGIRVRDDGINWIGDVNVNEYPYEIADAVLFANYFIYGIDVFMTDPYWRDIQINATDVNWDGITLSISDLVYLIRIILELETPFGQGHNKLSPATEVAGVVASAKGDQVTVSSNC